MARSTGLLNSLTEGRQLHAYFALSRNQLLVLRNYITHFVAGASSRVTVMNTLAMLLREIGHTGVTIPPTFYNFDLVSMWDTFLRFDDDGAHHLVRAFVYDMHGTLHVISCVYVVHQGTILQVYNVRVTSGANAGKELQPREND